jgi:hypothetical protein
VKKRAKRRKKGREEIGESREQKADNALDSNSVTTV